MYDCLGIWNPIIKKILLPAYLVLILLFLIIAPHPVLAIANPDNITTHTVKAFQNVYESDDILFIVSYDVDYAIPPSELAEDAFMVALYSGATMIASRSITDYQYYVTSLYFDSTEAAALSWEGSYSIKVMGNPLLFTLVEDTNMDTKVLAGVDWIDGALSTTPAYIKEYCLTIALALETHDSTTYIVTTPSGYALNEAGRLIFEEGVPGLTNNIPGLFQVAISNMDIDRLTKTGAKDIELTITNQAGAAIANSFSGIANYFGVTSATAAGLFIIIIGLTAASIVFFNSGNSTAAIVLTIPFLLLGNYLGLVSLVITFVVAIVIVMLVGYNMFLRGM